MMNVIRLGITAIFIGRTSTGKEQRAEICDFRFTERRFSLFTEKNVFS